MSFSVLFVCICVLNYCHRVATQLQLTNISYHITYHIVSYHIISYQKMGSLVTVPLGTLMRICESCVDTGRSPVKRSLPNEIHDCFGTNSVREGTFGCESWRFKNTENKTTVLVTKTLLCLRTTKTLTIEETLFLLTL